MLHKPKPPMDKNQSMVKGPKNLPIVAVPCRCTINSPARIPIDKGTNHWLKMGVAILRPSMAESTEIAGVIIPSPKNSDAPTKPKAIRNIFFWSEIRVVRRFNANSDMIPPSPLLSARMITMTYLKLMVSIMHQKIRDRIPSTEASLMARCAVRKHWRSA